MKRFWVKVGRYGPSECWPWKASTDRHGYGYFRLDGGMRKAHRVAYELTHGPIPDGQVVRHRCDNPGCVNPGHLELGTQADNVRDRDERKRRAPPAGANNGRAKLTAEQVAEIRARYSTGYIAQADLARAYGVSHATIHAIVRGKGWKI